MGKNLPIELLSSRICEIKESATGKMLSGKMLSKSSKARLS